MTEECGILNLATCIPEKMFDFFLNILNAPIQPLLNLVKSLLTEPINVSLFTSLWAIILYTISLFYGLLLVYAGFNFMISGYDAQKRSKAKEWLKNILIMIVLVQASYFLYEIVIDIGSLLTTAIINLIDESFFLITADNLINIGLQFFFAAFYVITLIITTILLAIRYIIVAVGVVFVPLGVFFYFIPPLQDYGKFIFNFLGICIFMTFFDALVFLVCSELTNIPIFADIKILVMIGAFSISNLLMIYLMFFSAIKSALQIGKNIGIIAIAKSLI